MFNNKKVEKLTEEIERLTEENEKLMIMNKYLKEKNDVIDGELFVSNMLYNKLFSDMKKKKLQKKLAGRNCKKYSYTEINEIQSFYNKYKNISYTSRHFNLSRYSVRKIINKEYHSIKINKECDFAYVLNR